MDSELLRAMNRYVRRVQVSSALRVYDDNDRQRTGNSKSTLSSEETNPLRSINNGTQAQRPCDVNVVDLYLLTVMSFAEYHSVERSVEDYVNLSSSS